MPDPEAGVPDMGFTTLTPVGEPLEYNYFPVYGPVLHQLLEFIQTQDH